MSNQSNPIWHPDSNTIVPASGGFLVLGERTTRTQIERGEINEIERRAFLFPRGSFGVGKFAGFRVVQSKVVEERGNIGVLTIEWEVDPDFGGDIATLLPPDDFALKPFEINPPLHQHPHFSGLTDQLLDVVRQAVDGADQQARDSAWVRLAAGAEVPEVNLPEAFALAGLLRKGVQTYYLTGIEYIWWSYSYGYPSAASGGIIETPGGPGARFLPAGFSWLRLCDTPERENGIFKLTRAWRGAPNGHWSTTIYS